MSPQFHFRPLDAQFFVRLDVTDSVPDFVLGDDGKEAGVHRTLATDGDTGQGDADVVVILADAYARPGQSCDAFGC